MLPCFISNIDGNLNGYVKGIETMWLEIGNEKAGHIFKSHKGWKLVMLRSNTTLTRSRLDGVDLHSLISCSFTTFFRHWSRTPKVALLLSLPINHLLKNPFLPYDSLDSSDGGQNNCWGLELQYLRETLCSRSQKASGRTLSEDLSPVLTSSSSKKRLSS